MSENLQKEFDRHIENLDAASDWLKKLMSTKDFPTFFERPAMSMLVTACDYVSANLSKMRKHYPE